jgi:poly(hydroxyalkanoate) depolymerase family esterase
LIARSLATLAAVVGSAAAITAAPAARADGSFTEHSYAATATTPQREYWLYEPASLPPGPRPLLVMLHGCIESATDAAAASHFDQLADRYGFLVAYPQELVSAPSSAPLTDGNGVGCWNWFLPEDQQRDAGEPGAIAGITREVMATHDVDPDRVYVAGISAGADMAVILGATYPDLYAAIGVEAGCAYATCADGTGELTHAAMGDRARIVPMFVENGSADEANNVTLSAGLVQSWLGVDDLADDGQLNGSVSREPAAVDTYGATESPSPGGGDPCIHNDSWLCPGGAVGWSSYPYTVTRYDVDGCDVVDYWVIHGMAHAHPDAPGDGPYTDPLGPDVSAALWSFFSAHPLGSTPCG